MIRRRAFTLLEMLLATTIVALLAGSLYAAMSTAFKARRTALASVDDVRKVNTAMELLRADLLATVPPRATLSGSFVGQAGGGLTGAISDGLTFSAAVTDVQPGAGVGDIKKIEYACQTSTSGTMDLVRRVTTNLLSQVTAEPKEEVLCRGLASFTLRYYDGTNWATEWDSTKTNALPTAVEVTLGLGDTTTTRVMLVPCGTVAPASTTTGGTP